MSTLSIDKSGKTVGYNIQWCKDGRRHTIYLGGRWYTQKTAEDCQECIDALLRYQRNNIVNPERKIEDLLKSADAHILAKLAKVGLIAVPESKTLQEVWDLFLTDRQDAKPASLSAYRSCKELFFKAFSSTECISDLTPAMLQEWKKLLLKRFKPGGVESRLRILNTFLNWAVKHGRLNTNPMEDITRERTINREKHRLISPEEYFKLLDACPNQEWRTIIALARIGGLRGESELRLLRWSNIMWETHRFLVQSPKTERYAGHRDREVPLFPELQEELQRLFDLVNPNDNDFIIQSYQGRDHWSLTGPFAKISKAAGLGKIAQPFLNMRRSRSNEILRVFGEILESLWLGHSPRVMRDHYLFPMIADYANAAMVSLRSPMPLQKSLQ